MSFWNAFKPFHAEEKKEVNVAPSLASQSSGHPVDPNVQYRPYWLNRAPVFQDDLPEIKEGTDYTLISPYEQGASTFPELINDYGYRRQAKLKPENTAQPTFKDIQVVNANALPSPQFWTQ